MSVIYPRYSIFLGDDGTSTEPDHINTNLVPLSTEGSKVIVSGSVLILITSLWSYLRFWSVRQSGRRFLVEDWTSLAALVLFYGLITVDFTMALAGGMGHHVTELQDWHLIRLLKAIYARQFLYAASLGAVKISVILLFMRIFVVSWFKFAAKAVMALTVSWMALIVLLSLLMCRPIATNWNIDAAKGACGNQRMAFAVAGIVDIINHLAIILLPLPVILKLRIEKRYKIATVGIFTCGILTLVFGAVNLGMLMQADFTDVSYSAVQTALYGASETGIAIVVSNCPVLRPVFDRLLPVNQSDGCPWRERGDMMLARKRKSTKSSGFTQMKNDSRVDLELGNMGAHRARRDTHITAGKRPPTREDDDDSSVHRIVVTSETIVSRVKGEL
ncbi:hypothetical protein M426DRAFT_319349 [Hypoxylon sp. CI-4A]|nr:hypothetical protein M426DRAFT_319349 [Hypoxylon sp. CI-4A]